MNYKNKNLEELSKKIDNLTDQKKEVKVKKKDSGAGFDISLALIMLMTAVGPCLFVYYCKMDTAIRRLKIHVAHKGKFTGNEFLTIFIFIIVF